MDDWGVLGLSIGTIANLAVAGATLVLVIYTYKSVKASEEQVTMNQKEKERPIVLEFINSVSNHIQEEIYNEIRIIEQNAVYWQKKYPIGGRDYATLVFPIPYQKEFYLKFGEMQVPWFLRSDKTLSNRVNGISKNLHKRSEIYKIIERNMEVITAEGISKIFNQIIKSPFQPDPDDPDFYDSFIFDPVVDPATGRIFVIRNPLPSISNITSISEDDLIEDIKSLIIISLFNIKPEWRLSKKQYQYPIYHVLIKVKSLLRKIEDGNITASEKIISDQLLELKNIDSNVLSEMSKIKESLQEHYLFTGQELNRI